MWRMEGAYATCAASHGPCDREERAAIHEFDGEMSREDAERSAGL